MKAILFWPYQLYVWLVFIPLAAMLTALFSALTVIFATIISPEWASRVFATTWGRLVAYLTPVAVTVEGADNALRGQSYIVASNHQSIYDIFLIYGWLQLDLKWVMKMELRKIPAIGIGCEKAGHIFVDRADPDQAKRVIRDAVTTMGRGVGVLFFPEGTRSPDGRLLSFKKGAFRVAIDQELPLLPVTLVGTRDVLPARSLKLFPGRIKMVIHPAIDPAGKSVEQMIEETRAAITSGMPAELR